MKKKCNLWRFARNRKPTALFKCEMSIYLASMVLISPTSTPWAVPSWVKQPGRGGPEPGPEFPHRSHLCPCLAALSVWVFVEFPDRCCKYGFCLRIHTASQQAARVLLSKCCGCWGLGCGPVMPATWEAKAEIWQAQGQLGTYQACVMECSPSVRPQVQSPQLKIYKICNKRL